MCVCVCVCFVFYVLCVCVICDCLLRQEKTLKHIKEDQQQQQQQQPQHQQRQQQLMNGLGTGSALGSVGIASLTMRTLGTRSRCTARAAGSKRGMAQGTGLRGWSGVGVAVSGGAVLELLSVLALCWHCCE